MASTGQFKNSPHEFRDTANSVQNQHHDIEGLLNGFFNRMSSIGADQMSGEHRGAFDRFMMNWNSDIKKLHDAMHNIVDLMKKSADSIEHQSSAGASSINSLGY